MKQKWSWWRAWLVQTVEMLILGGCASLAELLGAPVLRHPHMGDRSADGRGERLPGDTART